VKFRRLVADENSERWDRQRWQEISLTIHMMRTDCDMSSEEILRELQKYRDCFPEDMQDEPLPSTMRVLQHLMWGIHIGVVEPKDDRVQVEE
jgi:hypothetical protein